MDPAKKRKSSISDQQPDAAGRRARLSPRYHGFEFGMNSELLDFILLQDSFQSNTRLVSLYSDFSTLRTTNPDGFAANVSAWKTALEQAAQKGLLSASGSRSVPTGRNGLEESTFKGGTDLLSLSTGDGLSRALEHPKSGLGRPLGLSAVVNDAVARGSWIPLPDFLNAKTSIYNKSWITMPSTSDVASWILSQIGWGSDSTKLVHATFVMLSNVEEASRRILASVSAQPHSNVSQVFSLETFTSDFRSILNQPDQSDLTLSPMDVQIILRYLTRDKGVASMQTALSPDGASVNSTIKIEPAANLKSPPSSITEQDSTVALLNTLSRRLSSQVEQLQARVTELEETARVAASRMAGGSSALERQRALAALRSKKIASTTLTKREASLNQVESTLSSIEDAASQLQMVAAMETSGKVLRDLNKQVGGVERVESVMDQVADARADVSEVAGALTADAVAEASVDEGEVDDELAALEQEADNKKQKEEEKDRAEQLKEAPAVPTGDLNHGQLEEAPPVSDPPLNPDHSKAISAVSSGASSQGEQNKPGVDQQRQDEEKQSDTDKEIIKRLSAVSLEAPNKGREWQASMETENTS